MKKLRSAVCLLLVVCLMAACLPLSASAMDYKHLWRNFITDSEFYNRGTNDWYENPAALHTLIDIDGDGSQELILRTDEDTEGFSYFDVFRYDRKTGEIKNVWPTDPAGFQCWLGMKYSEKYNALVYSIARGSLLVSEGYYQLKNGSLSCIFSLCCDRDPNGDPGDRYYIYQNGRERDISGSEYVSYQNELSAVDFFDIFDLGPDGDRFYDVGEEDYYYDAVNWALYNDIVSGVTDLTFGPDLPCTRAQAVTFLWRAAGSPRVSGRNPFSDVSSSAYYYHAVLWAVSQGITSGASATRFNPNGPCTRGDAVTFLWRFDGKPPVYGNDFVAFVDVQYGAYYYNPAYWALYNDITAGTGFAGVSSTPELDTNLYYFSPKQTCTRAQIVTFLYRYLK